MTISLISNQFTFKLFHDELFFRFKTKEIVHEEFLIIN